MTLRRFLPALLLLTVGCKTGTLPDPNDPKDVGALSPDNMRDQLGSTNDMLRLRVAGRQITDKQAQDMLQQAAESLLVGFTPDKVEASNAWKVANVMITAKHWADAKPMLMASIEWARTNHNEDRRINDTIALAKVEAAIGDIPAALKIARSTFAANPKDAAPILYGAALDLPPFIRGKGHDVELGQLIQDAIKIDLSVSVDPKSDAGRRFIAARPTLVWNAWALVVQLYTDAKRPDLIEAAKAQAEETAKKVPPPKRARPRESGPRSQGGSATVQHT